MSDPIPSRLKILFVDDAPEVLQHLRWALGHMGQTWDMRFIANGNEALRLIEAEPCDVVVSDLMMPELDGIGLLSAVRERAPHTIRIVLSGDTSAYNHMRCAAVAHRFLSKPLSVEKLSGIIDQFGSLRELLRQDAVRRLVAGIQRLPSLPSLYQELEQEMRSAHASLKRAARVIAKDLAMTTKILQLVNSAYFGLRVQVTDPEQAVALLGLDTIKALVLSMETFAQFSHVPHLTHQLEALWRHGLATASRARAITKAEGVAPGMVDEAFTAALLHDVGILVLATSKPDEYRQTLSIMAQRGLADWEAEQTIFGATHAEIGAYLLGMWGLNHGVVEAVTYHHTPSRSGADTFSPLTAVHVANGIVGDTDGPSVNQSIEARLDAVYLARGSWTTRLPDWHTLCAD